MSGNTSRRRERAEYRAYRRSLDPPQRWAFWRWRDEFDGVLLGAVIGLAIGLPCILLAALS